MDPHQSQGPKTPPTSRFLGEGRQRRSQGTHPQACGRESVSGLSDSNSDSESEEEIDAETSAANLDGVAFD